MVIICVLGLIKEVFVKVNMKFGKLLLEIGDVIVIVVWEVFFGKLDVYFLFLVW